MTPTMVTTTTKTAQGGIALQSTVEQIWWGVGAGLTHAWVTGYRFPSVGANSGDTIQSAYLQLVNSANSATSATCGSAPCSNSSTFRVYGVAQDDGAAFSGAAGNTPLDVPYTVAYTDYTTTGPGDDHGSCQGNNNGQNTCTHVIDVTNIVREIHFTTRVDEHVCDAVCDVEHG